MFSFQCFHMFIDFTKSNLQISNLEMFAVFWACIFPVVFRIFSPFPRSSSIVVRFIFLNNKVELIYSSWYSMFQYAKFEITNTITQLFSYIQRVGVQSVAVFFIFIVGRFFGGRVGPEGKAETTSPTQTSDGSTTKVEHRTTNR